VSCDLFALLFALHVFAKWIPCFSDKITKLKAVKSFPLDAACLADFEFLKKSIAEASLQAIDESHPFVVECDTWRCWPHSTKVDGHWRSF